MSGFCKRRFFNNCYSQLNYRINIVFPRLSSISFSTSTNEPNNPYSWRKPWNEKEGEWYSSLNLFAPSKGGSPDIIRFLQQDIDFRPSKIQSWWKRQQEGRHIFDQRYIPQRHQILGNDLATAHFIVHRGGAVRFVGSPHWMKKNEDDEYDLPNKYIPDVFLDAVDASGMELHYDGLANIVSLKKLKFLNLRGCDLIDDWCLDRISGEHAETVENLDISHCPLITERGLPILTRMRNLRKLNIEGMKNTSAVRLTCIMLEELNPKLTIHGITHEQVDSSKQDSSC